MPDDAYKPSSIGRFDVALKLSSVVRSRLPPAPIHRYATTIFKTVRAGLSAAASKLSSIA